MPLKMKNLIIIINITFGIFLTSIQINAQEDESSRASAVCPSVGNSNAVLIMTQGNKSDKEPSGKLYDIGSNGEMNVRWEIDWYSESRNVFISGDWIVRIRDIELIQGEGAAELGKRPLLEFYHKGILTKRYNVIDLGNIGENFGKTAPNAFVYQVFAVHDQIAPRIVKQLEYEVNTLDQYRNLNNKVEHANEVFMVQVIGGDRIFFRISTGEILDRFKFKFVEQSAFR